MRGRPLRRTARPCALAGETESGGLNTQLFKTGENIDEFPTPSDPRMNLKSPSKWQVSSRTASGRGRWCPLARASAPLACIQALWRARDLIERALALRPEDPAVRDSLGWVLYRQGELEAARTHLQRAYSAYPDAEIGAHLGEVLWQLGERDQARAVWRQAQQADADNRTLRRTLERFLGEPAL